MTKTPPDRRVITFYSFKGGVGRTMAVANVAYRLANKHGLKVIAVDWDLEAPGLHRFFGISAKAAAKADGVLDYFTAWKEAKKRQDPAPPDVSEWILPIADEKHKPRFGQLSLLTAGRLDGTYDARLAGFHWQSFYADDAGGAAVETLREQLAGKADVVLIDSRTGLTDAGGDLHDPGARRRGADDGAEPAIARRNGADCAGDCQGSGGGAGGACEGEGVAGGEPSAGPGGE